MSSNKIKYNAMRLFTEHGYEGTSLADIADIVGIKKSSIYNHYKSKDDLFIYIFEYCSQSSLTVMKDIFRNAEGKTYTQFIHHFLHEVVSLFPTHYETKFLFRFISFTPQHLINELDSILDNYLMQVSQSFEVVLTQYNECISKRDINYFALHLRLVIYGLYTSYLCKNILPPQDVINYFVEVLSAIWKQNSELSIVHI